MPLLLPASVAPWSRRSRPCSKVARKSPGGAAVAAGSQVTTHGAQVPRRNGANEGFGASRCIHACTPLRLTRKWLQRSPSQCAFLEQSPGLRETQPCALGCLPWASPGDASSRRHGGAPPRNAATCAPLGQNVSKPNWRRIKPGLRHAVGGSARGLGRAEALAFHQGTFSAPSPPFGCNPHSLPTPHSHFHAHHVCGARAHRERRRVDVIEGTCPSWGPRAVTRNGPITAGHIQSTLAHFDSASTSQTAACDAILSVRARQSHGSPGTSSPPRSCGYVSRPYRPRRRP